MYRYVSSLGTTAWALAAACALLASCAPASHIRDVETVAKGGSAVFGRVRVFDQGKEKQWNSLLTADEFFLVILPEGSNTATAYQLRNDGSFRWSLAPGAYRIIAWHRQIGSRRRVGHVGMDFTVPQEAGKSTYIGDLIIRMGRRRYAIGITDRYAQAGAGVKVPADTETRLMRPVPRLGAYVSVRSICARHWGVGCTTARQGVVPLAPPSSSDFPQVASLTPKLEWRGPVGRTVTYDLVIHEAASWSLRGYDTQTTPGRVVLYKQNLPTNAYIVSPALKPKSKYFWSVRLRDGDMVSTWSRRGYFAFFVIGTASGSGLWFTFATP